jgi:hypothetical protein
LVNPGRKQIWAGDVGIGDGVQASIRICCGDCGIRPHGQRAGLVMGGSDPVSAAGSIRKHRTQVSVSGNLDGTAARENLKLRAISENPGYLISWLIHRVRA